MGYFGVYWPILLGYLAFQESTSSRNSSSSRSVKAGGGVASPHSPKIIAISWLFKLGGPKFGAQKARQHKDLTFWFQVGYQKSCNVGSLSLCGLLGLYLNLCPKKVLTNKNTDGP